MSTDMEYVCLEKSGLKVSNIVLGCMTYGDLNLQPWMKKRACLSSNTPKTLASTPSMSPTLTENVGMAEIAITWSIGKGELVPILGLESVEKIDQAVKTCKIELTREEMDRLEEPHIPKKPAV